MLQNINLLHNLSQKATGESTPTELGRASKRQKTWKHCETQDKKGQDGCEEIPEDLTIDRQDLKKKIESSWRNIKNSKKNK